MSGKSATPAETAVETAAVKRPPRKRLLRGAGWTLAVLVTLLVLLVAFLHTSWGKDFVRSRAESALQKRVNGTLAIGGLDYGFLFSDVSLRDLRIDDLDGKPAITLAKLDVDLDRGSLLDGAPIINELMLEGVRVAIVKRADGTSNLTGLFVPSERKGRKLTFSKLRVADVSVTIERPDGSRTEISEAGLEGRVAVNTVDREFLVNLSEFAAGATITRADGTVITIPRANASLQANVTGDDATLSVSRLQTSATLAKPGDEPKLVSVGLGPIEVSRKGQRVAGSVDAVSLGPLSVERLEGDVEIADGELRERQSITITGATVASEALAELLGRELFKGEVTIDASVTGPPSKLVLDGVVATVGGTLSLDGDIDADKRAYSISAVGKELDSAAIMPDRSGPPPPSLATDLNLTVSGSGIPRRPDSVTNVSLETTTSSKVSVRGRRAEVDKVQVAAQLNGKAVSVSKLSVAALGLSVNGTADVSESRNIRATVALDGNPQKAAANLRRLGIKIRPLPLPRSLDLDATVVGDLDGTLKVTIDPTSIALAGGSVRVNGTAELETTDGKRALSRADANVILRGVRIERLAKIAGRRTTLSGRLNGTVGLTQRGKARDIAYDVNASIAEPALLVKARGDLGARRAILNATVRSPEVEGDIAVIAATLPLAQRGGKRTLAVNRSMKLDVSIPKRLLADISAIAPPRVRDKLGARAKSGEVSATIELEGTPSAPSGTIRLAGILEPAKLPGKQAEFDIELDVKPTSSGGVAVAPSGDISVVGIEGPVVTLGGRATLGTLFRRGKLDREAALAAGKLGIEITVPKRELASLSPLRPKLSEIPGEIAAIIKTSGSPAQPTLSLSSSLTSFETASGKEGRVGIEASGTRVGGVVTLAFGGDKQATLGVVIDRMPDKIIVGLRADANNAEVSELIPHTGVPLELGYGVLDWKMNGELSLVKEGGGMRLDTVDLGGFLDVSGASVALPRSERKYHDIGLRIEGDGPVVRLAHLKARESDEQNDSRSLSVSAEASLADRVPTQIKAAIKIEDWLVFGGALGENDAPRASASADIAIAADLSGEVPVIDATIESLNFSEPNHSDRDHALQSVAIAKDIVFIGDSPIEVGKLGRVVPPGPAAAPRKKTPMLVRIHIPKPVRLEKTPLDIKVSGDLELEITETELKPRGSLKVHGGKVLLFGHLHDYESGSIVFDEANPKGALSLVFARELSPATLRLLSRTSGGRTVKITIAGSAAKRKIVLSGAGNSGMLEVMSAHNAGRAYYYSEPGLAASGSAQLPQLLQPLVLTYLATNLPHVLVLDRFSAWSEPITAREFYGRLENFVGEHNFDKRSRVRVVSRPRELGRSSTELQLDRLIFNTASTAIGVGARLGNRLGGGLALFFEWSSSN